MCAAHIPPTAFAALPRPVARPVAGAGARAPAPPRCAATSVVARSDPHAVHRPPHNRRPHPHAPLSPAPPPVRPPFLPNRLQQARLRLHLLHRERQLRRCVAAAPPARGPAHSVQPARPRHFVSHRLSARAREPQPHAPESPPAARPRVGPAPPHTPPASPPPKAQARSGGPRESDASSGDGAPADAGARRRARSERMRALWRDPAWRAAMMARRSRESTVSARSDALKALWRDPAFRARQRAAREGRAAWNKGVPRGAATRLRISVARKGMKLSDETKRRISATKRARAEGDDWPRHISESKKGKTKQYFAMRREFRALHRDLKLWSDSYRSVHGRLPSSESYEKFVAPMMVFRIRRYLTLRDAMGADELDSTREIID